MADWIVPLATAFWLGVLTSISPCQLAINIAAISFVGRRIDKPLSVLSAGLIYTAGRTLTYLLLGILLAGSMLSAPILSHILQKYLNIILGPILIVVGMVLLELIAIKDGGRGLSESIQKKAESSGIWGAGLLGITFALSFCPTSAALFFGSLIPLALKNDSAVMIPVIYGIGTGAPVLVFTILLSAGATKVVQAYNKIIPFGKWGQRITGIIFIGIGIYLILELIFGIHLW